MPRTQVKRPSEVDPLELELHFDVYECPHCVGGEVEATYPDSYQTEWEICDQCNGEGELAVRRSSPGLQTEDIEHIKFSLALSEEQCKAILDVLGLPSDGLVLEIVDGSTVITFPQNQIEGDRHD